MLGGWLVDVASWRWVFLINLPLAVVVVWIAARHLPETRDPESDGTSVDLGGGVLGALALAGLNYALIERGDAAWPAGAVAVVALVAFVLRERSAAFPVLPFRVFTSLQFSATNAVTFLVYGAIGVTFSLLVVQLQVTAGFGPVAAGSSLLPITAVMLVLSVRSGALASRIGPRLQMSVGPLLCAGGTLLLARIGEASTYLVDVLPGVLVFGLGLATQVAPLTATALAAAPAEHAGMASGVNNAVARTGGLVAVAAVPALVGIGGIGGGAAVGSGYQHALWVAAGLLVGAAALAAAAVRNGVLDDDTEPAVLAHQLKHCGVDGPLR